MSGEWNSEDRILANQVRRQMREPVRLRWRRMRERFPDMPADRLARALTGVLIAVARPEIERELPAEDRPDFERWFADAVQAACRECAEEEVR